MASARAKKACIFVCYVYDFSVKFQRHEFCTHYILTPTPRLEKAAPAGPAPPALASQCSTHRPIDLSMARDIDPGLTQTAVRRSPPAHNHGCGPRVCPCRGVGISVVGWARLWPRRFVWNTLPRPTTETFVGLFCYGPGGEVLQHVPSPTSAARVTRTPASSPRARRARHQCETQARLLHDSMIISPPPAKRFP